MLKYIVIKLDFRVLNWIWDATLGGFELMDWYFTHEPAKTLRLRQWSPRDISFWGITRKQSWLFCITSLKGVVKSDDDIA